MRRCNPAVLLCLACFALALPAIVSISGCGSAPASCGGQCAPPYELQVDFQPGTAHAAAQELLTSCAAHNPVVIRIGTLHDAVAGDIRAMIYTRVFGDTPRTAGLLRCMRLSGLVVTAGWPD
jgi:hypothetical protein